MAPPLEHGFRRHIGRPGPPASGPRQGLRGHGVSPHPMERGQPRWGRLADPSGAPDVVTVHLNSLTHDFQHDSAALTHAFQHGSAALTHAFQHDSAALTHAFQYDSAALASGLPSSGGEVRELTPFDRNLRYVTICIKCKHINLPTVAHATTVRGGSPPPHLVTRRLPQTTRITKGYARGAAAGAAAGVTSFIRVV